MRGARSLILDLRGNPGGHGAMAIPVASRLVDAPLTLGTIGVIGPARMNYSRVIPLVDFTAEMIGEALGKPQS